MPTEESRKRPCCLVSEVLEECGVDREKVRQIRRQVLEGLILFCQWQLGRMERGRSTKSGKRAHRVSVD